MNERDFIEPYKSYFININRVPENQFPQTDEKNKVSSGFGWAFGVSSENPPSYPTLILVIKHRSSDYSDADVQTVLALGRELIHSLIDNTDVEAGNYHCYWWNRAEGLVPDDCDSVSPGDQRSPIWKAKSKES